MDNGLKCDPIDEPAPKKSWDDLQIYCRLCGHKIEGYMPLLTGHAGHASFFGDGEWHGSGFIHTACGNGAAIHEMTEASAILTVSF